MTTSDQVNEIAAALAKAQGQMKNATLNKVNPHIEESRLLHKLMPRRERAGWQHSMRPLHERLLSRVVWGASDCWHYCGARNSFGYGRLTVKGRLQVAHRLSYEAFIGPIPDGMSVLHHCDNPSCINPDHLWLGTYSDNRRDCVAKGRDGLPRGERHWNWRGRRTA